MQLVRGQGILDDIMLDDLGINVCVHRFVLAATDHLHKRISKMTERIRQLEDALAIMHGDSDEPHPLLRDELLNLKVDKGEDKRDDVNEVPSGIDALGTLSINDRGNVHFFGSSGGSEVGDF